MNTSRVPDLSPRDLELIKSLRRRHRLWPRVRWVVFASGLIAGVASGLFARILWLGLAPIDGGKTAAAVGFFAFMCITLAWMAFFCFAVMVPQYPGHKERSLLLRLADAQRLATEP